MNIKDSYIHNGTAVLKDIKVESSVLKKILAGKDANDAYLDWETVCDLTGIKPTAAGTADKVGHKLTFSGGVTGDWDGSEGKTVAIPTKESWNYDDVYLKDLGLDTGNSTDKNTSVSLTNGNVYLKLFKTVNGAESEDSKVKIYGATNVSVTTDASGDIKITGVDSVTTATYASNVGAAGTVGTNYVTAAKVISACNWYDTMTSTSADSDAIINRWTEMVSFISGIAETDTLSGLLANYLPLTGGTLTNSTDSILTINRSTANTTSWIKYSVNNTAVGFLGVSHDSKPYFYDTTARLLYHSGNLSASSLTLSTADQTFITIAGNNYTLKLPTNSPYTYAFSDLTAHPTTLSGYGITDAYTENYGGGWYRYEMTNTANNYGNTWLKVAEFYSETAGQYSAAKLYGYLYDHNGNWKQGQTYKIPFMVVVSYTDDSCKFYYSVLGNSENLRVIKKGVRNYELQVKFGNHLSFDIVYQITNNVTPYTTVVAGTTTSVSEITPEQLESYGNYAYKSAKLATKRKLTIGASGKDFDGTADVSWSLTDIGAASSTHDHDSTYLKLAGGTLTNTGNDILTINRTTANTTAWIRFNTNSVITGYIGVGADKKFYFNNTENTYEVYHTGNLAPSNFVSALQTSGNYLQYKKYGDANWTSLTIPYASNANTVDNYHAADFCTERDYVERDIAIASANNWFCIGTVGCDWFYTAIRLHVGGIGGAMHNCATILVNNISGWSLSTFVIDAADTNTQAMTKIGFWSNTSNRVKVYIYIKDSSDSTTYPYTGYRVRMYYNSSYFSPSETLTPVGSSEVETITRICELIHGGNRIYGNLEGTASNASVAPWDGITSKPETATRWPSWSEVTDKPESFPASEHTHDYLPLTGGTLSLSNPTQDFKISHIGGTTPAIRFDGVSNGNNHYPYGYLGFTAVGAPTYFDNSFNSYTLWHSGNDGHKSNGTGPDADLLDGNHASAFVVSLGTSGNYLTWTRSGGTAQNITVPYASNAGAVGGKSLSDIILSNSGQNLIKGSSRADISKWEGSGWSGAKECYDVINGIYKFTISNGWRTWYYTLPAELANVPVRISFDIKLESYTANNKTVYAGPVDDGTYRTMSSNERISIELSDEWVHYSKTITPKSRAEIGFHGTAVDGSGNYISYLVRNLKCEVGTVESGYSANQEDYYRVPYASEADLVTWAHVSGKPAIWDITSKTATTYSVSNTGWTNTITLPTDSGSYILTLITGNSTLTGVFSIGSSDTAKDEISLHLHGNGPRLYARTNGTTLQLSSNDASATSRSVVIKYKRLT